MTDVAFALHPTPLGDVLVATTDVGLVSLHVVDGDVRAALADLAIALHAVPREDAEATASVTDQLDAYFAGDLHSFDLAIDWTLVPGAFARRALQAVADIPYGEIASYGEVAVAAGSPGAHRAVGSACARTPISIVVPAHRVVRSDGSPGDYGGHPERRRFLLELEGAWASVRV